jgi:hypothetical protein
MPGRAEEFRDVLLEASTLLETRGDGRVLLDHFNTGGSPTDEPIDPFARRISSTNDVRAIAVVLRSLPEFPPDRARLETNIVSCLCVIGAHDPNLPGAEATAEHRPNLKLEVLPGENHCGRDAARGSQRLRGVDRQRGQ